ncbi:B12-binding domain-containing radical SAM protein [Patescibacteria group bacterium]
MKVSLIVSANITDSYGFNVLAAQLKNIKDVKIELQLIYIFYDFNKHYPQQVVDDLVALCAKSDLIGISLLSSALKNSIQISGALRKNIDCPIIWGGKHPTADPEECIKHADIVALSEGEDTLLEVVKNIHSNKPLNKIQGTWVKGGGVITKNELRPLETNLDRFSPPDYSIADKYVLDKKTLRIRLLQYEDLLGLQKWYPTMITRGCPNCCTFCSNSADIRLRTMRSRSPENVILEVKGFLEQYPNTKRIFFRDDCLSAMPLEFIKNFSKQWKEKVGLPCSCSGVIADSPNFEEKIELLVDAGFTSFKMGIQSGNERVRRFVFARVGETDQVMKDATRVLGRKHIGGTNYYMITDNPYEEERELAESIRFTSRIPRPFSLSLFSLNFYPGTVLYNRAIKDKIINKEDALQESTMIMKNTYLNKVFLSLRYFAIPPFMIDLMTNKTIYSSKIYIWIYNKIFHFIFLSDTPHRRIKIPRLKRIVKDLVINGNFSIFEPIRWLAWVLLNNLFNLHHKVFRRNKI